MRDVLIVTLLAVVVTLAHFVLEGRAGLSLADEGYLWYGSQRTMIGDVPIRDFMAYDPGRYYWCSALMRLVGDNGIMALRVAVASFEALGIACGLYVLRRAAANWAQLVVGAVVLALWMFPRHKLFDISICLMLVAALCALLSQPSRTRFLILGAAVGIAAVFGRNHGVYGAAGSVLGFAYLMTSSGTRRSLFSGLPAWSVGIVVGYLPVLFMFALVPGFARAFWQDVLFLVSIKTTNLPLPVPWPWAVDWIRHGLAWVTRDLLIGLAFVALVVTGVGAILVIGIGRMRKRAYAPALVAPVCFILPYAHYAFSRADIGHLALGIFPLLLTFLVVRVSGKRLAGWSSLAGLLAVSALIMVPVHPGFQCTPESCSEVMVGDDKLLLDAGTASSVTLLQRLEHEFLEGGETFVATPYWPGAYAVLGRRSPVWEIYALSPY